EVGLRPDGREMKETAGDSKIIEGLSLSEALRTPAFYIICCGLFSLSMLVTSLHVENKGILTRHGLDPQTATLMFTISGLMAAISMPVIGRMLDRYRTDWMFSGGLLVMCISLISVTFVEGISSAVLYSMVFGLNNGVTMTYFAFFWPRFFGRKYLGSIQGVGQMIGVVGASIGPLPLALAVDFLGDYDMTLRYLAILPAVFSIVALFLRTPPKQAVSYSDNCTFPAVNSEPKTDFAEVLASSQSIQGFRKGFKRVDLVYYRFELVSVNRTAHVFKTLPVSNGDSLKADLSGDDQSQLGLHFMS
ncbi:uncharacterized protein METZ01_LOCUS347838, partial [marine metagenome]